MATGSEYRLRLKRVFAAASSVVFAMFSDPNAVSRWWGPEGFTIPSLRFDPRVGDQYRIEMQPPDGDTFALVGEFREVNPPTRLAYTFVWDPPDADDVETLAVLTFHDLGDGTEVVLTQGAFRTEARCALHRDGWTESLDKAERLIGT
jgi:uncharacterized protein YndB with AHSA1/START domain